MKLSEFFSTGGIMYKKARLIKNIKLDDGEERKKGDIITLLKDYGDGYYHAEDNEFACKVSSDEIEII